MWYKHISKLMMSISMISCHCKTTFKHFTTGCLFFFMFHYHAEKMEKEWYSPIFVKKNIKGLSVLHNWIDRSVGNCGTLHVQVTQTRNWKLNRQKTIDKYLSLAQLKATTVVLESVLGKVEGDWNSLMRAQADILFSSSGEMWNLQRKMNNQPPSDKLPDN